VAGSLRLVKAPDVYELRVYVGRDQSGRVKHRYERFSGNKRAAQRALAALVAEVEQAKENEVEPGDIWGTATTLNAAFAAWKLNGWQDLSPSTTRRYESIWQVHIEHSIGLRKISELGAYDFERFFRKLKSDGQAESSVRQIRAVLNRTCRLARRWSGGVLPNPAAETELPNWSMDADRVVRAPDATEVAALLSACVDEDPRVAAFVRVVTATGVRRGEACALRWSDIDFENRTIIIDESIVASRGGAIVKGPKTRASIRRLSIDAGTADVLASLLDEQRALAAMCETRLEDESFVFSFEPGGTTPPYPDVMSHAFANLRDRAKVAGDVHLHSLRHFQATVIDSVVSERQKQARLGWATVHMARHYTDAVTEEDQKAAEFVGRLLDEARPQVGQSSLTDG
jgi:integrase